ncbi:MAG TPA: outer membrane beta-barrel protein [Candidatus Deferrimicrobiaceae bacterium]
MRSTVGMISALLCLVSAPAFAEHAGNYVTGKVGYYSPRSDDLPDLENGFSGELGFGRYLGRYLAAEVDAGYFETGSGFQTEIGAFTPTEDVTIKVYPVTVTAKAVLPLQGGELYGGGGLGVYFAEARFNVRNSAGSESSSGKDTIYGGHILFGGNYDISRKVFVGAEFRHTWTSGSFNGSFRGIPFVLRANLDGYMTTFNLGYRF